jgi:hypothetical protein
MFFLLLLPLLSFRLKNNSLPLSFSVSLFSTGQVLKNLEAAERGDMEEGIRPRGAASKT